MSTRPRSRYIQKSMRCPLRSASILEYGWNAPIDGAARFCYRSRESQVLRQQGPFAGQMGNHLAEACPTSIFVATPQDRNPVVFVRAYLKSRAPPPSLAKILVVRLRASPIFSQLSTVDRNMLDRLVRPLFIIFCSLWRNLALKSKRP